MKIAVIAFTRRGNELSQQVADCLRKENGIENRIDLYTTRKDADQPFQIVTDGLKNWCGGIFPEVDAILFVGASGIAVRTIAPFVAAKQTDPAILVMDEQGQHLISLLSGHLGGGNELTRRIAGWIGADPVITTASDVQGKLAVDVWAKKNHLKILDYTRAKEVAARIVAGEQVPFYCEGVIAGKIPEELQLCERISGKQQGIAVSIHSGWNRQVLRLVPQAVVLGIGCRRGKNAGAIQRFVQEMLKTYRIAPESIASIASIDLKAEETGILALAESLNVPFETFSTEELQQVPGAFQHSAFVQKTTGVDNVCERAAVAAGHGEPMTFLMRKQAKDGVTLAIARKDWRVKFE